MDANQADTFSKAEPGTPCAFEGGGCGKPATHQHEPESPLFEAWCEDCWNL